jgi:hypothetical protein
MNTTAATTTKLGSDIRSGDILVNNWNSDRLPVSIVKSSESLQIKGVVAVAGIATHAQRMYIWAAREYTVLAK